jgi:hypothetical protein
MMPDSAKATESFEIPYHGSNFQVNAT